MVTEIYELGANGEKKLLTEDNNEHLKNMAQEEQRVEALKIERLRMEERKKNLAFNDAEFLKEMGKRNAEVEADEREAAQAEKQLAVVESTGGGGYSDTFELTDTADAMRLLEYSPFSLLVALPEADGSKADVYITNGLGLWQNDRLKINLLLSIAQREWLSGLGKAAFDNKAVMKATPEVLRHARKARNESANKGILSMVGEACLTLASEGRLPHGLTVCFKDDIDKDTLYLGCANGVVDLRDGRLLPPEEGRIKFITQSTGIDYKPDAPRGNVRRLLNNLSDEQIGWLFKAVGFAMRGIPDRRGYLVEGSPGGGKSTLKNLLLAACGDYAVSRKGAFLLESRFGQTAEAPRPAMLGLRGKRLLLASDVQRGKLDRETWNTITGGDMQADRALYSNKVLGFKPTSTPFIMCNEGYAPIFPVDDGGATKDRMRVLPYPSRSEGERDSGMVQQLMDDPETLEGALAWIISEAVANPLPPADIPEVMEATMNKEREMAGGDAYDWIMTNIVKTGQPSDKLATSDLWTLAGGTANEKYCAELDCTRTMFSRLITSLHKVKRDKIRMKGVLVWGWTGIRLATAEERAWKDAVDIISEPEQKPLTDIEQGEEEYCITCEGLSQELDEDGICGRCRDGAN